MGNKEGTIGSSTNLSNREEVVEPTITTTTTTSSSSSLKREQSLKSTLDGRSLYSSSSSSLYCPETISKSIFKKNQGDLSKNASSSSIPPFHENEELKERKE